MTAAVTVPPLAAEPSAQPSELDAGLPQEILDAAGKVEGQEAGKTAEVPATPAAEASPDKVALAAETLRKARKIAKSRREAEARADREKLRADQFAQRLEQEQKERAAARADADAFKKDPLDAIRKAGITAKQLAERAINEGTPEAKFAALEASIAEREARLSEAVEGLMRERERERWAVADQAARASFFALVRQDTHPRLHRLDQDIVLSMSRTAFDKARANGHSPTDKQVLDYVEGLLASPQNGSAGPSMPQTNQGSTAAKPVAKPSPTSRTVTADLAGRRYTAPQNFEDLDLAAQKDALAKMLEDAERGS